MKQRSSQDSVKPKSEEKSGKPQIYVILPILISLVALCFTVLTYASKLTDQEMQFLRDHRSCLHSTNVTERVECLPEVRSDAEFLKLRRCVKRVDDLMEATNVQLKALEAAAQAEAERIEAEKKKRAVATAKKKEDDAKKALKSATDAVKSAMRRLPF